MAVDITINETIDSVDITVNPNIIEVNVTRTSGVGGIQSIVAGTNISVDNTDPLNPIVSATGIAGVPNFQEVTDEGNTTTNDVIVRHSTDNEVIISSITDSSQISVNQGTAGFILAAQKAAGISEALIQMTSDKGYNLITEGAIQLSNSDNNTTIDLNDSGLSMVTLGVNQRINLSNGVDDVSIKTDLINGSYEQQLPNKSGTFAMLDDVPAITTATTGAVISFANPQVYNSIASPSSSNLTDNLTGAKIGIVQKIYHNAGTAPTVPAGWVLRGTGSYVTSTLNIIYAEWSVGTTVEYWITQ